MLSPLRSCVLLASVLAPVAPLGAQVDSAEEALSSAARATLGSLELPSYAEGLPDPNPPFDAFRPARINYPYSLRTNLTNDRGLKAWRAVFLENEYLRCSVLPDLGGHLYSCTDKISGNEMFYANPSIKLTQIGYRGAWAAFGVEFNFPVSHNWMSASPIDFAYRNNADGSASVWVGNIDRVYGTDWRVELRLRPGRAVLEQHTTLYNRSDVRHRYYWWTNAAVRVTDESQVLYPMQHTASHGFTQIDTWPIDQRGTDNSRVGNHLFGPVSRFSHGSREAFMAVYHPDIETGVMHFSAPDHLPAKKIWSWGGDARGLDWRQALSDDSSAYVEIQAGVFRNQETYGFLEPQERLAFSEYWTPLRSLGGLSRANPEVQLHLCRVDACGELPSPGLIRAGTGPLRVRANVTRALPATRLIVRQGDEVLLDERMHLDPWTTLDRTLENAAGPDAFSVLLVGADGQTLIDHTEGQYQYSDEDAVQVGPQAQSQMPPDAERSESEWLVRIDDLERNGERIEAWTELQTALQTFPESHALTKVAGRLAVVLRRYDDGVTLLERVVERVSNDAEATYYLGLAQAALGEPDAARIAWEASLHDMRYRAAAHLQLGLLRSRAGARDEAVAHLASALDAQPRAPRTRALLAAVLRANDQESAAFSLLDESLGRYPSHSFLRYETLLAGATDPSLLPHLAGDPERILEIAAEYFGLGQFETALGLLDHNWDIPEGPVREPGQPSPSEYPLVHLYRAFAQAQLHRPYEAALAEAESSPLRGVFPNRPETGAVLQWALGQQPRSARIRWLLGALELQSDHRERAVELWQDARNEGGEAIPALHRSLGVLLVQEGDVAEGVSVLRDGIRVDPTNMGVYAALDDGLQALGATAAERADALLLYPSLTEMPAALVYLTARRLSEAGRFDEAEELFADRFFPREEGGINVRQVYLEVRLARARAAAERAECRVARSIVETLLLPDPSLDFTYSGLELWLERGELGPIRDEVLGMCGPQ